MPEQLVVRGRQRAEYQLLAGGIDEKSLFRGPEARARKYASEELLNYWEDHPRPTEAYFRGEDTTLGMIGTRRRLTSADQQERDWYERLEREEREGGIAA